MALTDLAIRTAKAKEKAYKLSDSAGLYLLIKPTGTKYWRLKYRIAGKEKLLAIGSYPDVTLLEAREKTIEAKKQISNHIDPTQIKKEVRLKALVDMKNSFEEVARCWHNNRKGIWTPKHAASTLKRLELDIFPYIGFKSISTITAPELLALLRAIENRGALEIAHRTSQICGQIFRYGIAIGVTNRDIVSELRGALKARKQKNYAHLKEKELPEFLMKLENYDGEPQTKLGLKFLILTFTRTGEVRGAKWSEIDFDKKEWRIPAERMKMREQHIVPLSDQAMTVLHKLRLITGSYEYLFPNRHKSDAFMSENTMLYAIYRMGYHSRTTTHGFRSTASTILNEHEFMPDVIERQLAHAERNSVRASYNHAEYLPERRKMMQWWGDYVEQAYSC